MLKLKYLFENFDLARMALQRYNHDIDSLEEILPHFRISASAVYPYLYRGQLCYLRMIPAEEKSLPLVQAEIDFIQHLRQHGYSAMKPIPNDHGQIAWLLNSPWGDWCVSSFEGVRGKPVEEVSLTDELVFRLGASLAQLHTLAIDFHPCPLPSHKDVLAEIRQMLLDYSASPAIMQALNHLECALDELPVTPNVYGPLHYDFEPDNVFWDGQSLDVIDFGDAMQGWYALDVEQALDALNTSDPEIFLAGYRSIAPYSCSMDALRPLMRRFINLRRYARLCRCLQDDLSGPEWLTSLKQRLWQMQAYLEQQIQSPHT